ncbi:helix-turn-helix domain-containing protein [Leucobacter celer]|uniref:helix-turn-helix domain-containing protein n=1 Tax=Leucobacter celer TaxID=668625 RepID=UPI00138F487B|nr:helix-turn-helix transcriptional regulator [Leucobacter celer]
MTELSAGEVLARGRKALGWSQRGLAEKLGCSTVLISKIESGARAPSAQFLQTLDVHLPEIAEKVRVAAPNQVQTAKRQSGGLKIVDAMKLAKENAARANRLRTRAEEGKRRADEIAGALDERVREFDREAIEPVTELLSRVTELPDDILPHVEAHSSRTHPEFAAALEDAQLRTGRSIFSLIGAGVLGGGAGAAVGAGAATATYMTVASLATASTGAAISSLSGAAATSATLAAIGGGSLAAGGLGIAGGTTVLTGIVALPVLTIAAFAIGASGGRILETQKKHEMEIVRAEQDFTANEVVLNAFVERATKINEILKFALSAINNHKKVIEDALPHGGSLVWAKVRPEAQASIRRVAEIILACLTVLALPIGMNLKRDPSGVVMGSEGIDAGVAPQFDAELDAGSELEGEFIDYAIEESFRQVAR